jgi:ribosomal protein S27AE
VANNSGKWRRSVVQSEDQLKELKQMSCGDCGYTIFPALGRSFRYTIEGQLCPVCGSDDFYDKNDENDSRNLAEDGTNLTLENRKFM